jgi:hypothetical protein
LQYGSNFSQKNRKEKNRCGEMEGSGSEDEIEMHENEMNQ